MLHTVPKDRTALQGFFDEMSHSGAFWTFYL